MWDEGRENWEQGGLKGATNLTRGKCGWGGLGREQVQQRWWPSILASFLYQLPHCMSRWTWPKKSIEQV